MKTTSLILFQTTVTIGNVDYLVAVDVRGTRHEYREGYEHFGYRGSQEQSEVTIECEGFSAFDASRPEIEIMDKAILREISAELEEQIQSDAVLKRFDFEL